jgi:hypothetical protein
MKYYTLLIRIQQSEQDVYSQPKFLLPSSVKYYAILNENSVPADPVANEFYRQIKVKFAKRIANSNILVLEWCTDKDCNPLFPVDKAEWTAGVIAQMLGG